MTPEQKEQLDNINSIAEDLPFNAEDLKTIASFLSSDSFALKNAVENLRVSLTPKPTYQLITSSNSINEGESVMITLKTTNVSAGTKVDYSITGNVDTNDFEFPTSGFFVVGDDGSSTVVIKAKEDELTEGDEHFVLTLTNDEASIIVVIKDTSQTPVVPPTEPLGIIETILLKVSALIIPESFTKDSTSYERHQILQLAKTDVFMFKFRVQSFGSLRPFRSTPYKLMVNGTEHTSATFSPSTNVATLTVRCNELPHGWNTLVVVGESDETAIPCFLYVKKHSGDTPSKYPLYMGSHDCHHLNGMLRYQWSWVPTLFKPTILPLTPKIPEEFSTVLSRKDLVLEELVVARRHGDLYRPRVTDGDVINSCNSHNYLVTPIMEKIPDKALLDGPRGMCSVGAITHLQIGRNGGVYFCEGQRIGHISTNGTIRTIAGLRSRVPAARNRPMTAGDYELVGNWDAVPVSRHGFHEMWGMAFWLRSLEINESATAIPNNGTLEKPHVSPGPVLFVADTQNNRILKLQFAHNSHEVPVVITEFIVGLKDPWDIVCVGDYIYVSERLANRISVWSAFDGSYVENVLTGPSNLSFANLDSNRKPYRIKSLSEVQAAGCVLPEGLYHLDGWLYMSSIVMQQIKKINLVTKEVVKVVEIPSDKVSGGIYNKIAVSDGTFGVKGTVFLQSWSSGSNNGVPWAWLPDGTPWAYHGNGGNGPGKVWHDFGYGGAVAVGKGRMVFSASIEGVFVVTKAKGEKSYEWDTGYKASMDAWFRAGYHLTHGPGGFGYFGLPLPWDVSPDIDRYLEMYGHTRGVSSSLNNSSTSEG